MDSPTNRTLERQVDARRGRGSNEAFQPRPPYTLEVDGEPIYISGLRRWDAELEGRQVVSAPAARETGVIDLAEALKRSVEAAKFENVAMWRRACLRRRATTSRR